ncbi:MAG: phosphatidate cytidylyltransferase [Treponema sp. GWB1_62_6]|nr:MAG: phosphatidate cytidylyltransferase [Treponema sp. GWA1_62_8]OHE66497.1 MAG: phosphatidate cytidylyltransferase [Treponema sp. GWB1_62_6]OHE69230.1 MAG: phosphatidate cytidylyltransferase [Treponema sp. GWC1_61_84]OHE71072.1 MAG: phosphatidate cytidylyltransferase [Treponema sp. RIFOXYC1_FULL_61_9]HCM27144.1 phosphatidate cytidylyltransferase [Treponema sp.]
MRKLLQRLAMFVIGLPLVISIVAFLPQFHHLAANLAVTVACSLGAIEFASIIGRKGYRLPDWEAAVLGALAPFATTLAISFGFEGETVPAAFIIGAGWIIASRVFSRAEALGEAASRVTIGLSTLVYPGVFMLWIIRMGALPNSWQVLLIFLLSVFANDSLAWFFGMVFGKGNRGFLPASPNKSIAGFVGGLMSSVTVGVAATLLFPAAFTPAAFSAPLAGALLGALAGAAGIIGDLAESTIKRSAEVKDSGSIIPGRGGILDSIDSLAFAAPVFYAAYLVLF